jgi:signal transduction histidine kinase
VTWARSRLAYPSLVPSSLLPPEDPSRGTSTGRTVRDWVVDILLFLLTVALGGIVYFGSLDDAVHHVPIGLQALDLVFGVIAVLALWGRRQRPLEVAVLAALLTIPSAAAAPASVVALFSLAVHRRTALAAAAAALNLAVSAIFPLIRPQTQAYWVGLVASLVITAIVLAWGMFVRARRQLVWSLRVRAERAEAEQQLQAERARTAERTRIAREMHDVLGHRISLLALHAGGLQLRPDLPPEQVRQTADLLRATATQALDELRGVIGVLRDEDAAERAPDMPQPTLGDIPRLVADTQGAGAKVTLEMHVPDAADLPAALGRDAYRVVQEALTNVAKHATGTTTSVQVDGAPGDGLRVRVSNRLPVAATRPLPGSGSGLLGLRERVTLAGGTLEHGPTPTGDFVVDARFAWS